jgi:hypothetical protein
MSISLSVVGALMLIGVCTVVLADYWYELIDIDLCLDDGNVYDYNIGQCRERRHPCFPCSPYSA